MLQKMLSEQNLQPFNQKPVESDEFVGEKGLEEIARLAAQLCSTPLALVQSKDGGQHWFKARPEAEMAEIVSGWTEGRSLHCFSIGDKSWNDCTIASSCFSFCQKIPLLDGEGTCLGHLWVMDNVPHKLDTAVVMALESLGKIAAQLLKTHCKTLSPFSRKAARIKARQESQNLEDAFNAHPDPTLLIDCQGKILLVNRAAARQQGYEARKLNGSCIYEILPTELAQQISHKVDKVIQTQKREQFGTKRGDIDAKGTIAPIFDRRGKLSKLAIVMRETQLEKALLKTKAGLKNPKTGNLREPSGQLQGMRDRLTREIARGKTLETQLRETQDIVQALLNATHEIAGILDRDGTILAANSIAGQQLGMSASEIIGLCAYDLLPSKLANSRKAAIDRVFETGKPQQFEDRHNGRDIDNSIYPICTRQNQVTKVAIFARDITERNQCQLQLKTERERLYQLLDRLPAFVYLQAPDCSIRFANRYFRETFGEPEGKCRDNPPAKIQNPGEGCPTKEVFKSQKSRQWEWHSEDDRTYEIYDYPFAEINGDPLVLELGIDISDRKRAEEGLRSSEALYRLILTNVSDAVFITDDEGALTFICPNAEAFFGYSVAEMQAMGNIRHLIGEDLFDLQQLQAVGEIENIEREVREKNGRRRTVLINVKRVAIQNGTTLYCCRDITDRKQAQMEMMQTNSLLEASEERFRLLVEGVRDYAIFMLDPVGKVVSWNEGSERITGYLEPEIIGQHFGCFYTPEEVKNDKPHQALRLAAVASRMEEEGWRRRHDGSYFWGDMLIAALRDERGYLRGFSVVIRDITERKRLQDKLWHAAFHDALTGLPNRAMLTDALWDELEVKSEKAESGFALLFLDLDGFKLVNDSLGHNIGDELLVAIARRLENCLRSRDLVARLGGDEFAILLRDMQEIGEATAVAQRIHQVLEDPFQIKNHKVYTNASIGIAFHRSADARGGELSAGDRPEIAAHQVRQWRSQQPEDILRHADTAMYRAKREGRGCFMVFNETMHAGVVEQLEWENDLRRMLQHPEDELLLHYQPIVCLKTGQVTGFEALVRWQHPEKGMISPSQFIPIAEQTGAIVPLGIWVLREACWQLRRWHEEFPRTAPLTMNVNLSGKQFSQPDFIEQIDGILAETGIDASCLKLEITESMLMENPEAANAMLAQLRKRQIQLCIDDFGTGYSSLSYLRNLPVNTLKIDRSFVMDLEREKENGEIVRTILMLGHNLRMDVVCEGVETPGQFEQLSAWQCDYGQGYLFGKPCHPQTASEAIATVYRCNIRD